MNSRFHIVVAALAALALPACEGCVENSTQPHQLDSFRVEVKSVHVYETARDQKYTTWSAASPLPLPRVGALLEVEVTALDEEGKALTSHVNPISFRVTPGKVIAAGPGEDLTAEKAVNARTLTPVDGVAKGYVWVEKTFGAAELWAQDSPPAPVFALPSDGDDEVIITDGGVDAGAPDVGPGADAFVEYDGGRTFAAGVSASIYFDAPLLADMQALPGKVPGFPNPPQCTASKPGWSNKTSPFVGNFLTVEAPAPRGDMIVTAIMAEGFYVSDKLAQPVSDPFYTDDLTRHRTLPGSFGHMYVYNFSFPDGLYTGDRVLSLTGTVQEFSGHTQLVFPSWVRKEGYARLEDRPAPLVMDFSYTGEPKLGQPDECPLGDQGSHCDQGAGPTYTSSLRCVQSCGTGNCLPGQVCNADRRCVCQVAPEDTCAKAMTGTRCDESSGNCVGTCPETPCAAGSWCVQHRCVKATNPCAGISCPKGERCNTSTGACECGPSSGYRISKTSTYRPPVAGKDSMDALFGYSNNNIDIESLESSVVKVTNVRVPSMFVSCDANGNSNIPPFRWFVPNGANGCGDMNAAHWGCDPAGADTVDCECNRDCTIGRGPYEGKVCTELNTFKTYGQWTIQLEDIWKIKLNVLTRDALPDFDPREFTKPEFAGCRMDITGILRQVQAARPRWAIVARDEGDVCCRAEPGGKCPTAENGGKCPKCPDAQE